jgi:flagellar protein FlaG
MSNDGMSVKARAAVAAVPVLPTAKQDAKRTETATAVQPPPREISEEQLKHVTQRLEAYLRSVGRSLEFRVDAASGRTVVTVRDAETGDVVRQIPGEEVLRLSQMAPGERVMLLDEKV